MNIYQGWGLLGVVALCLTPVWLDLSENSYQEPETWTDYGPVVVKSVEAVRYSLIDENTDPSILTNADINIVPLSDGSSAIIHKANPNELYIAFPQSTVDTPNSGRRLKQETPADKMAAIADKWSANASPVPFLKQYVPGATAPTEVIDLFSSAVGSNSTGAGPLTDAINKLMAGERILHITCTGQGESGGLAMLCGLYASLAFPQETFVDVITFGTPWSGFNSQFAYFFDNMVNLYYLWPFQADGVSTQAAKDFVNAGKTINSTAALSIASSLYKKMTKEDVKTAVTRPNLPPAIPADAPPMDEENVDLSDGDYEAEVNACYTSYKGITLLGDPYGVCQKGTPKVKNLGSLGMDTTLPPENQPPQSGCPPIVCKTWKYLDKSCLAFQNDTVLDGLPYVNLNDGAAANAIVSWNVTSKEIIILWKYTEETRDWITDANIVLTDNLRRTIEKNHGKDIIGKLFNDPEVHSGFYNQFKSLTVVGEKMNNLTEQIYNLTNGESPRFVKISGFSLGGAVSEISAVWAAYEWPSAHIYAITQGAPKVGTNDYLTWFKSTVGRVYRYVYNMDEVPAIPPLDYYNITRRHIWITSEGAGPYQVLLTDRPPVGTKITTWYDHWCEVFYVPLLKEAKAIAIPKYVAMLQ